MSISKYALLEYVSLSASGIDGSKEGKQEKERKL